MRSTHGSEPEDYEEEKDLPGPVTPERMILTPLQTEFLTYYSANSYLSIPEICRMIPDKTLTSARVKAWIKKNPKFRQAMVTEQVRLQKMTDLNKEKVVHGILQAIDIAKEKGQASGMISGYREIGRMCGFYEPEVRQVNVNVSGEALMGQLQELPKDKLLELAKQHNALEGEFERLEVPRDPDEPESKFEVVEE